MPHEFKDDTLQDIKDRDVDNLSYVLKNAKERVFTNLQECISFTGEALNTILMKHDIDLRKFLNTPELLDANLLEKGIRVEHRNYDGEEDDIIRSGIYVYKVVGDNSEIVGFIGKPQPGRIVGTYTVASTLPF